MHFNHRRHIFYSATAVRDGNTIDFDIERDVFVEDLVGAARALDGLPPIDIAIFDEAHKTTGRKGGMFSYALDDEALYGPRAHTLTFGAAANKDIICRYKVIISLIDKQMVDDFSHNHGITLVEGDEINARWVSNLVALDQAVKEVGASKIITFHSRVAHAQEFATNEPRGIAHYLKDYDVRHVNGAQNSSVRGDAIDAFAATPQGLITNARCLTEGVDIPTVDMVAFINDDQIEKVLRIIAVFSIRIIDSDDFWDFVFVIFCFTPHERLKDAEEHAGILWHPAMLADFFRSDPDQRIGIKCRE